MNKKILKIGWALSATGIMGFVFLQSVLNLFLVFLNICIIFVGIICIFAGLEDPFNQK